MDKGESLIAELQHEGCRITPLRRAMIEVFYTRQQPLTLEDLQEILVKRSQIAHRASLYREIDFLKRWSVIDEVFFDDGRVRYEFFERSHHHHLVCVKCRDVHDVPLNESELKKEKATLEERLDFTIFKHSLEFFGLCAKCR